MVKISIDENLKKKDLYKFHELANGDLVRDIHGATYITVKWGGVEKHYGLYCLNEAPKNYFSGVFCLSENIPKTEEFEKLPQDVKIILNN